VARGERPRVIRGDLLERFSDVAAEAPADATLVVFHTAVLAYLSAEQREQFSSQVRTTRAIWISNEGSDVVAGMPVPDVAPVAASHFLLGLNGRRAVAYCDGHGRWIQWL